MTRVTFQLLGSIQVHLAMQQTYITNKCKSVDIRVGDMKNLWEVDMCDMLYAIKTF